MCCGGERSRKGAERRKENSAARRNSKTSEHEVASRLRLNPHEKGIRGLEVKDIK